MATLPTELADQLPSGMTVEIASLTEEGQQQVIEALTEAADSGSLTQDAIDQAVTDGENADESRENVEMYRQEQAEAVAAGDLDRGAEQAKNAEYELREIDDLGGSEAENEVIEAQQDQAELHSAEADAEYAQDNANFAAGDGGTEGQREAAAETAAEYGQSSLESAGQADMGGTDADHSYTATTTDTTTDSAGTDGAD